MPNQPQNHRSRPITAWFRLAGGLSFLLISASGHASETAACTEATAAEIFAAQSCTRCHSVADRTGEQIEVPAARTPPSAGALRRGSEPMQPERVKKLLEKRFDGRGMRHPIPWKGDDAEISCLVAWLGSDLSIADQPTQPGSASSTTSQGQR